jgi:putative CocE/NonD family hydrolase
VFFPSRLSAGAAIATLAVAATLLASDRVRSEIVSRAKDPKAYSRRELSIPMRDGTRLFAIALVPTEQSEPLPIILIRTAFDASREFADDKIPSSLRELGEDGYIFVTEDIRGRGKSQGTFITNRAQNDPRNAAGTNESTDAWDTIDWLVKNLANNNGKVGVMGISYRGWLAALAGVDPHPALKAISPQAPTSDTWLGDDFFHQGAFRQTQGVLYSVYVESSVGLTMPDSDEYVFYQRFPTLDSLAKTTGVLRLPSWSGFVAHPAYDSYWQAKALQRVLNRPTVPTLFVGGWWDEQDILGPELEYQTLEVSDTRHLNYIVLGPWNHGQWPKPRGSSLGPLEFGSNTADYFRDSIQRPWFSYYLHGKGNGAFPEARVFETGANEWRNFDAWPPKNAKILNIFLADNGKLSFEPAPHSSAKVEYDSYRSDPADPVPNVPRPDNGDGSPTWLVQDQRFVEKRPDVLSWKSAPLDSDLVIAGDVSAHLFASTTGSDADWVVKLIDVYPDTASRMAGYELMVNADIMRGRYWKGFSRATPIPSNTVTPFTVYLHQQLYRFRKGHRVMIQVQSSWFPLYDRNPQTFVENIFNAKPSDFRAQEHRIWHTRRYPSRVSVMVLPSAQN